jgi:hypothetical protein
VVFGRPSRQAGAALMTGLGDAPAWAGPVLAGAAVASALWVWRLRRHLDAPVQMAPVLLM